MWNTAKFDNMAAIFTQPVAMVSHSNRVMLTPDMLKRVITAWRKSMPDLTFKIEDTVIQGDTVAMRLTFTGTYKERLFAGTAAPTADNPRTVHASEMLLFHLKYGRIHEIWEEYDEILMHVQMGGFWRTNQELEAAAAASKPAPVEATPPAPAPKP
jgi:predicted ester cyclase